VRNVGSKHGLNLLEVITYVFFSFSVVMCIFLAKMGVSKPLPAIYRGFRSYEIHLKLPPLTPLNPPAAGGRKG